MFVERNRLTVIKYVEKGIIDEDLYGHSSIMWVGYGSHMAETLQGDKHT
jgi:hypothetical protein